MSYIKKIFVLGKCFANVGQNRMPRLLFSFSYLLSRLTKSIFFVVT